MKKYFFIFNMVLALFIGVGYTLNAGVSYNLNTARQISFSNIQYKIDVSKYRNYFYDKNKEQNLKAKLRKKNKLKNRYLTFFSDGTYGVIYKNNTSTGYYYNSNGKLKYIEISYSSSFPKKFVKYDNKGNIDSVSLWISSKEQFVFSKDKVLQAHWINENKYNENGELIDIRH